MSLADKAGVLGGILSYFTRHKTIANILMAVMVIAGLYAVSNIRSQFFPDTTPDTISVNIAWPGAGALDVDSGVVAVAEPALLAIEGVATARSVSREGRATVSLEFESGWDMDRATEDVKAAVDAITNLPEAAEDPTVRRNAWRDRVTDVIISGPVSVDQLGRFADEFAARLFREGISKTTVRGVSAPIVRVTVPEGALIRNDVSLREISDAIGEEAEADPAGDVGDGSARLRSGVEKRAAEDVAEIVVRSNPDGSKLLISDVAAVTVEGVDRESAYFLGENPAIIIRVDRSESGDAIRMQDAVIAVAEEFGEVLPEGTSIQLTNSRTDSIKARLSMLLSNAALGLLLVIVALFLFLNPATAFWVTLGIPVALLATIAIMYASGQTINMLSLFALIICLGIVVDDAIVVGEHADFRLRRLGEGPVEASENAAIRMGMPVFSSTLTTVIAFLGITFVTGHFGRLVYAIPFAVVAVLIASLIECFLILPHHMSKSLRPRGQRRWYDQPSYQFNRLFNWVRTNAFRPFLKLVIALRYPVLALALLGLSHAASLFMRGDVTWRFFNAPEWGSVTGNFAMLPGASREDARDMMRELQRAANAVGERYAAEHGANPVKVAIAQIGGTSGRGLSGQDQKEPDQLGSIRIELIDADLRPYSSFAFLGAVQEEVRRHPMLETLSFRGGRFGPGGDALEIALYGASTEVLKEAAETLKLALARYPEVSALEDDMAYDKTDLVIELTPLGKSLGFTIDGIGRELRDRLNGIDAAEFPIGSRTARITVSLPSSELGADFIERTRLRSPDGVYVVLSDIVTISESYGFNRVIRRDGITRITVSGDISEDDPERALEIQTALEEEILPEVSATYGVDWVIGGLSEQEDTFLKDAQFALYMVLIGIFACLAWVFQSWTRPIVVMAIIPFGLIGTVWGHYIWDIPISLFTVLGLLGMTGIIINDSIVLVSTIDEYAKDRGLRPAVIDAAADRLRPVLLTTVTTVVGIAPLLFEESRQAQFLRPTVVTLSYGLGLGFFFVLLVVPSLVIVQQDVGRLIRALRRGLRLRHEANAARLVLAGASLTALASVFATVGVWQVTGAKSCSGRSHRERGRAFGKYRGVCGSGLAVDGDRDRVACDPGPVRQRCAPRLNVS